MLLTVVLVLAPMAALSQDAGQLQRMFEAGKYQQVVETTSSDAPPPVLYTAAQSHQKLGATDQALETYRRLTDLPENDPWHFVRLAGQQLLEGQNDGAVDAARRAVVFERECGATTPFTTQVSVLTHNEELPYICGR